MDPVVIAALVTATAAVIGSIMTLVISLKNVRVEREHLRSEIAKLQAETDGLRSEADDARRLWLEAQSIHLSLEKQKALNLQERRRDIYPEMLELVYRLRNGLRYFIDALQQQEFDIVPERRFGEDLYLLTDNMYRYRALIDEETFTMLHRYKRLLQDARVLLNRITRPSDSTEEFKGYTEREARRAGASRRYHESSEQLDEIYHEVNALYPKITESVKSHIEAILKRSLAGAND